MQVHVALFISTGAERKYTIYTLLLWEHPIPPHRPHHPRHLRRQKTRPISLHDTTPPLDDWEDEQTRVGQRVAPSWPALGSDGFGMAQRGTAQASQFYRQGKSSLKKDNGGTAESEYTTPHIVA